MADPDLHGAVLRRDLVAELGEHPARAALREGVLVQPWRGVVVHRERALRLETRAAAALLVAGERAVLTGPTAVAVHGCAAAADHADVHLLISYGRRVRSRPGLVVHTGDVAEADVVTRNGLPVVVLELALAEVLCDADHRLGLACLDQGLAALPAGSRQSFAREVRHRIVGLGGPRATNRAVALVSFATGKAESPPESWLRLLVVDAGFPLPEAQFEVRNLAGRVVYRLDLAWPELRIALEYDGYEAHEDRSEQDAERDRRLGGRGWTVIRARARDRRDPARLLGELRAAFAARGRVA